MKSRPPGNTDYIFLIRNKKQSSTIKSYISAIKAILLENNIDINEDRFLLNSLIRACKLTNDKVRVRWPISQALLDVIIQEINTKYEDEGQAYLARLFKAIFASAYFGLLRIGEVASSGSHPILARDVQIATNKKKIMFILRSSKTHEKISFHSGENHK